MAGHVNPLIVAQTFRREESESCVTLFGAEVTLCSEHVHEGHMLHTPSKDLHGMRRPSPSPMTCLLVATSDPQS